jgi:hypothetical protein
MAQGIRLDYVSFDSDHSVTEFGNFNGTGHAAPVPNGDADRPQLCTAGSN